MKKRIIYLLQIVYFLFHIQADVYAQLDISYQNIDPPMPTWQTYEFMRYGKIGASLYTGTVNYSIPFYTYKDKDFEIPISFDYASNGFRVNTQTGNLGHEWLLNTGGMITREIKGFPDDEPTTNTSPQGVGTTVWGFYHLYNDGRKNSDVSLQVLSNESGKILFVNEYNSGRKFYDMEPDIFHFNFFGYSGSFHFWYGKEIKIFNATGSSEGIRINVNRENNNMFDFEIITPDGYKYLFGDADVKKEYICEDEKFGLKEKTIVSWKLSRITAPNGRMVVFDYDASGVWVDNENKRYIPKTNYYNTISSLSCSDAVSDYLTFATPKSINPYLTKISINSGSTIIQFQHTISNTEQVIHRVSGVTVAAAKTALINKIAVIHRNDTIKKCNIEYEFSKKNLPEAATGNIIPFLSSVNISGEGTYQLNYYDFDDKNFPYLGSFSSDHWGYYNGKNNYQTPIDMTQSLSYDAAYNESLNSSVKNPDATYARRGMLKKIIYPTGGSTEFNYEAHDYSAKVVRNSHSLFEPKLSLLSMNETTGGLRINKITNYNTDGTVTDSVSYYYQKENGLSSGIQMNVPRYGLEYGSKLTTNNGSTFTKTVLFYSLSNDIYAYDKTHIEYSMVTEQRSGNGKTIYYYTNSNSYPDRLNYTVNAYNYVPTYLQACDGHYTYGFFDILDFAAKTYISNILTPAMSEQSKRGKLWKTEIRDANNTLLRREITEYEFPLVTQIQTPKVTGEIWRSLITEETNSRATKTTVWDYSGNVGVENETQFTYNNKGQVTKTQTKTSNGDSISTHQVYVTDIAYTPPSVYKKMIDKNVIGAPVKTFSVRNNQVLNAEYRHYNEVHPGIFKPERIDLLPHGTTVSMSDLYPGTQTVSRNKEGTLYINNPKTECEDYTVFTIQSDGSVTVKIELDLEMSKSFSTDKYFEVTITNGWNVYSKTSRGGIGTTGSTQSYWLYQYIENTPLLPPGNYTIRLNFSDCYAMGYRGTCKFSFTETNTSMIDIPYFKPEIYYKYDNYGNVIESKPAGSNVPTAYLWGYNYQYPIAKLFGIPYDNIPANTLSNLQNLSNTGTESSLRTALNNLRTQLPNAQITTYTYKPLVGMLTATDPRGATTYYDYDTFGRLKKTYIIENGVKKVIENYNYHYKD